MPISLIIFDLDGTLADTLTDITNSLNHALKAKGLEKTLTEGRVKGLIGEGVGKLIEKAISQKELENPELAEEIKKKFIAHYKKHLLDNTEAYPWVPEVLKGLYGFKKAVISNKMYPLTKKILEGLGLAPYFDIVAGPETAKEKKPSPAPVLYVLDKLGLDPSEAVMIGDSKFDFRSGKAAKVKCTVGVSYGYGNGGDLKEADYVIGGIDELVTLLYKNEPMLERRTTRRD
ncbi:MAG: HAD-IA family hydrolase [Nitrospiraceae bacterium]|nr:HAD-IA family hydrolase [Nitrospiraceae bacterium]